MARKTGKTGKTNAMRMLETAGIPYRVMEYEVDENDLSGAHVAAVLGEDPDRIFKTLVARGEKRGPLVFCIPVCEELDLKKAAKAVGEKSVEMIHVADINKVTGYIRGGCSPVGMKKLYPTVFDQSVENLAAVIVSGGRIGCQVEVDPHLLLPLVKATTAPLTYD